MRRRTLGAAAAVTAAVIMVACGGGGGGSSTQPRLPANTSTPPPSAANRTSVGTAHLTLALPQVLKGTNAEAIKGVKSGTDRHVQYINPSPNPAPTNGAYGGNVLDIYVDGTLQPNIDGSDPDNLHSMVVGNPNGDGTQNVIVPLYSTSSNTIVAVEYDSTDNSLLAIGEANNGGFSAGNTVSVTLTMQMNAQSLGVVDLPNESNPALMNGGTYSGGFPCTANTTSAFGVYTADAEGVFVPVTGYGGTSTPTVSGTSDGGGTTRLAQSPLGSYFVSWDAGCDGLFLSASAPNPAWALYNDVVNTNYSNYLNGFNGNFTAGPNQGLWTLNYRLGGIFGFNQAGNTTVVGTIDMQ